jgi:hypothetical protein
MLDAVQEIFGRGYQDREPGRAVSAFECRGKRLDGIAGDPGWVRALILMRIGGAVSISSTPPRVPIRSKTSSPASPHGSSTYRD